MLKKQKGHEYLALSIGNLAGLAICNDTNFEDMPHVISKIIEDTLQEAIYNPLHPFRNTYARAKDRLVFLNSRI